MKRTVLVTGGTRGIGAAISLAFHKAGYRVAAVYQGNEEVAQAFQKTHGIGIFRWDVSDAEACQHGVDLVARTLGPVDILVNNAGITRDSFLHKMSPDQWHQVIQTNLNGTFYMIRAVIEGMRARSFGRIISLSSVNAQKGQIGQTNYCASKAALLGMSKALARECVARNITVNVVCPGYVATDMVMAVGEKIREQIIQEIPAGRLGTPEEIAHGVLFLARDEAGFITGSTFSINGGQVMD
jgi:acetoacetyl-CoA reductase